jgi:hypothetical protein
MQDKHKKGNKMKLDRDDVEELAREILNLSEEADTDTIEEVMFDEYDISIDSFQSIVERLVEFTIPAQTAITGEWYLGFVKDGDFIVKVKVKAEKAKENE